MSVLGNLNNLVIGGKVLVKQGLIFRMLKSILLKIKYLLGKKKKKGKKTLHSQKKSRTTIYKALQFVYFGGVSAG